MRTAIVLSGLMMLVPGQAISQQRGVELGAAVAGLGVTFRGEQPFSPGVAGVAISGALFRTERLAFESMLMGTLASSAAGTNGFAVLDVSAPVYIQPSWGRRGPYLRPLAGVALLVGAHTESPLAHFTAGIGAGTKIPLQERLSLRMEAILRHNFGSQSVTGPARFGGLFGLSWFVR